MKWTLGKIFQQIAFVLILVITISLLPNAFISLIEGIDLSNLSTAATFLRNAGYTYALGGTYTGDILPATNNTGNVGADNATWGNGKFQNFEVTENFTLSGDIYTDRWLGDVTNTFVGVNVTGLGNLSNAGGGSHGKYNTALGWSSLASITTGFYNVALGDNALQSATNAAGNVAIGSSALGALTTGGSTYNTAIGVSSLQSSSGQANTAVGGDAGLAHLTGDGNTFIGRAAASLLQTGGGNIFLGSGAGSLSETTYSNRLYISNAVSDRPLIYGDFAYPKVVINSLTANQTAGYTMQSANFTIQGSSWNSGSATPSAWNFNISHNVTRGNTTTPSSNTTIGVGYSDAEVPLLTFFNTYGGTAGINIGAAAQSTYTLGFAQSDSLGFRANATHMAYITPYNAQANTYFYNENYSGGGFVFETIAGVFKIIGLPNADPHVAGRLYYLPSDNVVRWSRG